MIRLHHLGLEFQPQRTLNRVTKQRHDAPSYGLAAASKHMPNARKHLHGCAGGLSYRTIRVLRFALLCQTQIFDRAQL